MEMNNKSCSMRKPLMLCSTVTASILGIAIVVCVTLGFTVFKPQDPTVVIYLVGLTNLTVVDLMAPHNVTTKMVIGINNKNFASFKFANATSLVTFDNKIVGEAPILGQEIEARSAVNITTRSVLMPSKMMTDTKAIAEIVKGKVMLKSTVMLYGKSSFLGVKVKTSVYVECYLTILFGKVLRGESRCRSKLKIN